MNKKTFGIKVKKEFGLIKTDMKRNWTLYLMIIPPILYFFLFNYKPLYGALIAFQDYRPTRGFGVEWVGFKHFIRFFENPYFGRLLKNTLSINIADLIFGFPAPIILALMLNEMKHSKYKVICQSITYLPHFISSVVICGMIVQFCLTDGIFNDIAALFGAERVSMLQNPSYYQPIYVISGIWQNLGWNSIIFLAALAGVDKELYDAASVDGAGKWKQMIHITIPSITPTIIIMFILRIGSLMSMGHEKTMLLYNESVYETADVISTYVYRYGMMDQQWSYSTAANLFNTAVNLILLFAANKISGKVSETSLW